MPQLKMVSSSCMHRVALAGGTRESGYSRLKWKRTPKHCKPAELDIFLSGRPIGHIPRRVGLSRLPISPALCLKIVLPRFRSSCILWWKSSRRLYGHRTFFASYGLVIDDHGFGSRPSFRRSAKREREREGGCFSNWSWYNFRLVMIYFEGAERREGVWVCETHVSRDGRGFSCWFRMGTCSRHLRWIYPHQIAAGWTVLVRKVEYWII